jgi:hypothetical protein
MINTKRRARNAGIRSMSFPGGAPEVTLKIKNASGIHIRPKQSHAITCNVRFHVIVQFLICPSGFIKRVDPVPAPAEKRMAFFIRM